MASCARISERFKDSGLIPLTSNEIAHLLAVTIPIRHHDPEHHHRWSAWRRRHQHTAQRCHYQRRQTWPL
jgi:hypothetical protein